MQEYAFSSQAPDLITVILICAVLGMAAAYLVLKCLTRGLTTVYPRREADHYLRIESLNLDISSDTYEGTQTERIPKPQKNSR